MKGKSKRQAGTELHYLKNMDPAWYTEIEHYQGVTVISTVVAVITSPWNGTRTRADDFTSADSAARMLILNAEPTDHRGHAISSSVGGKTELYNLLPQTEKLNLGTGVKPNWKSVEGEILTFLRNDTCHFVDWDLELRYFPHNNRPHTFLLQVLFMTGTYSGEYERLRTRSISCNNVTGNTTCIDLLAPQPQIHG